LSFYASHPEVSRRAGGLESLSFKASLVVFVSRRAGGLETDGKVSGRIKAVSRRAGGLESARIHL